MKLYHYTHLRHWDSILAGGAILAKADSNLHPTIEHHGPDVIWFTTEEQLTADHGLKHPLIHLAPHEDKRRIRIAVDIPKTWVFKWIPWAKQRGIPDYWLKALLKVGGGPTWRVTRRNVASEHWVEVWDLLTEEILWKRE